MIKRRKFIKKDVFLCKSYKLQGKLIRRLNGMEDMARVKYLDYEVMRDFHIQWINKSDKNNS